jgi:hypothetical protein
MDTVKSGFNAPREVEHDIVGGEVMIESSIAPCPLNTSSIHTISVRRLLRHASPHQYILILSNYYDAISPHRKHGGGAARHYFKVVVFVCVCEMIHVLVPVAYHSSWVS